MRHAVDLSGAEMVVLTKAEYETLVEDAGDLALAADAMERDRGAPSMPGELLEAQIAGRITALTAWRRAVGWTQAELAQRAGVRAATISEIEAGKIDPRLSTLRAIAGALGLGIEDIVD